MHMVPKQSDRALIRWNRPLKALVFHSCTIPRVFTTLYSPRFLVLSFSLLGKIGNYMCVHLGRRKNPKNSVPKNAAGRRQHHRSGLSPNRYKLRYSSLPLSLLLHHQPTHTFARSYICAISIMIDLVEGLNRSNNFNARTLRKPPSLTARTSTAQQPNTITQSTQCNFSVNYSYVSTANQQTTEKKKIVHNFSFPQTNN